MPVLKRLLILTCCLIAFAVTVLAVAGQPTEITGTVLFADELPARNLFVQLLRDDVEVATTRTDRQGRFVLRVAPAAGQTLVIEDPEAPEGRLVVRIDPSRTEPLVLRLQTRARLATAAPPPPPPPPPPAGVTESRDNANKVVQVFYATDRGRGPSDGEFLNARSSDGHLTLGRIDVNIPPKHRLGELERPSWWTIDRDNLDAFFVVTRRSVDTYDDFYRHLAARVSSSPGRDAFVFIHGYNVSFDDAVFRAAQIAHDLTFHGAPIVYSWPSKASMVAYAHDHTSAQQTVHELKYFLLDVANKTGASTIHLIGHSMGNLPLSRAVTELAGRPELRQFKNVVLAAPDIDAVVFRQQIAPALIRSTHVTLYASSEDQALRASKLFNGDVRAGDSTSPLVLPGMDTIDASRVVTDFLGHSPFVPSVLIDLFNLFNRGDPPGRRFGMRSMPAGELTYWIFEPVR